LDRAAEPDSLRNAIRDQSDPADRKTAHSQQKMPTRIVAFAGSLRRESFNKKLVFLAAAGARNAGAEVTLIDLRELPMPLYDGDIERDQGLPANAKVFKKLLVDCEAMLISSPEYNSATSAVLKNAIDWASRTEGNEAPLLAFKGKVVGLMSASPGNLGGTRGLAALRSILSNIGAIVLPTQVAISRASAAFSTQGILEDPRQHEQITNLGVEVATFAMRLGR
jgi:chromate reductase, NAD(P)H dehydrogenase (quinone)